jgi:hypothetical protein
VKAIDELVRLVRFRADMHHPCYLLNRGMYLNGIVVPTLYGGTEFAQAYRRATVQTALSAGLLVLGDELVDLPKYGAGGDIWRWFEGRKGRTITAAPLPNTHSPEVTP